MLKREFGLERDSLQSSLDIATALAAEKSNEVENYQVEVSLTQ